MNFRIRPTRLRTYLPVGIYGTHGRIKPWEWVRMAGAVAMLIGIGALGAYGWVLALSQTAH